MNGRVFVSHLSFVNCTFLASFARFPSARLTSLHVRVGIFCQAYVSLSSFARFLRSADAASASSATILASFAQFRGVRSGDREESPCSAFIVVIPGNPRSPHRQIPPGLRKFGFVCVFFTILWLSPLANRPQSRRSLRIFGFVLSFQSLATGTVSRRSRSPGRSSGAEHPCSRPSPLVEWRMEQSARDDQGERPHLQQRRRTSIHPMNHPRHED